MIFIIILCGLISSVHISFGVDKEEERITLAQRLSNESLKINDYIVIVPSAYAALKKEVSMHDTALSYKFAAIAVSSLQLLKDFNGSNVKTGKRTRLFSLSISPTSIFNMMHKKDLTQGYALRSPQFSYTELLLKLDKLRFVQYSHTIEHFDPQSMFYPLLWKYNPLTDPQVRSIKIPQKNNKNPFLMLKHIVYIELYYGDNQLSDWIKFESF